MTIRVLLVDDHNLVKMGICSLLQLNGNIEVVAQLDDGVGVIDAIHEYEPDLRTLAHGFQSSDHIGEQNHSDC